MKLGLLTAAVLCVGTSSYACDLGTASIAPLNSGGWAVDVVLGIRQWDGGTLRLQEPKAQPANISVNNRSLTLSRYGGDKKLRRDNGGVAIALSQPIGPDIRRALDATGVIWQECDGAELPVFGDTDRIHQNKIMQIAVVPLSENRAAAVRWYDETFSTGVHALSREIIVLKK